MNGVRSIAVNAISLGISEIVTKVAQFLIFVFIARSLGSLVFGKFNFAYAVSIIAVLFMDMGINYMLIRDMAKNRSLVSKYIANSFIVKTALSIVVFVFVYLIFSTSNYPDETKILVYILVFFAFLKSFTELLFSVFKAYEAMHYEAVFKILRMAATLAFGLFAIRFYKDIVILSAIFVIVEAVIFILSLYAVWSRLVKINASFDYGFSKKILKDAVPFSLSMIFASIYFYIDSIMLSVMKGDGAVGTYSAAYNLTLAILFIPGMYVFAIYPVLSKNLGKFRQKIVLIYERSFKYMYMIGLPISIGFFILAQNIILFTYGREFFPSVAVLKLVSWFVFIKFVSFITGIMLSVHMQHLRTLSQGITALLNIILNLLLIPRYGFIGAGIATLISEAVLFALTFIFVSKFIHAFNALKILYKPLIASAVMAMILVFLDINMFALIITGAVVYFAALFLLRAFDKKDFLLMKRLVKNE